MEDQSKLGFAVVGYGRIGRRHASVLAGLPEAKLCAFVEVDENVIRRAEGSGSMAKGAIAGTGSGALPFFRTLEDLLASPVAAQLDVVNITTPNGCHASQACTALEAGLHVVIEKPLALTSGDAERVILTAERLGKQVFVVMQNRYSPAARWLGQLVGSGKLGRIFMVQMDCYWNRDQRYYHPKGWHGTRELDGGTLFTQFSHWVDMLYWLFGDITQIRSRLKDFAHQGLTDFEDSGFVSFDFVGGGMGSLNFSTAVWGKNLESSLTIIAEYGSVKIGGQYMERVEYCHGRDLTWTPESGSDMNQGTKPKTEQDTRPNTMETTPDDPAAHHRDFLGNVIDVLKGRAVSDIEAWDGWKVVDIIERIYKG
jgi:UDP-N-acetyl-2-amino-2-deoxyglucuronate dehydrogenase